MYSTDISDKWTVDTGYRSISNIGFVGGTIDKKGDKVEVVVKSEKSCCLFSANFCVKALKAQGYTYSVHCIN